MTDLTDLAVLADHVSFRATRKENWKRGVDYWLRGPLRHVVDVGDYIAERTESLCHASGSRNAVVVDMGFGDAWLLKALLGRRLPFEYVGLDCTTEFVLHARARYAGAPNATFHVADLEEPTGVTLLADVVVNSFNFFELSELSQPFKNAADYLKPGGTLCMSTIDKTFLVLALSRSWDDFHRKLALYQSLPGTKYAFQPIDLGNAVSEDLYYPSVLYSTEDYLSAAAANGLVLKRYKEHAFTGAVVPKIYCHFEFEKPLDRGAS